MSIEADMFQIHTLINTGMNDPETSSPIHRATYCAKEAAGLVHGIGPALLAPVSNKTSSRGT